MVSHLPRARPMSPRPHVQCSRWRQPRATAAVWLHCLSCRCSELLLAKLTAPTAPEALTVCFYLQCLMLSAITATANGNARLGSLERLPVMLPVTMTDGSAHRLSTGCRCGVQRRRAETEGWCEYWIHPFIANADKFFPAKPSFNFPLKEQP